MFTVFGIQQQALAKTSNKTYIPSKQKYTTAIQSTMLIFSQSTIIELHKMVVNKETSNVLVIEAEAHEL